MEIPKPRVYLFDNVEKLILDFFIITYEKADE